MYIIDLHRSQFCSRACNLHGFRLRHVLVNHTYPLMLIPGLHAAMSIRIKFKRNYKLKKDL